MNDEMYAQLNAKCETHRNYIESETKSKAIVPRKFSLLVLHFICSHQFISVYLFILNKYR